MQEDLVDVKEAKVLTGYSEGYIRILAKQGTIKAEKMGNSWVIFKPSLLLYAEEQKGIDGRYGPKPRN